MALTIPLFSLLTLLYRVLVHCTLTNAIDIVPSSVQPGPSVAQFVSRNDGLGMDGPKVYPINGSSYDWWYFDAVASDGLSSVVVVFYTATPGGFPFPFDSPNSSVTLASVSGSFANGSLFDLGALQGTSAIIETTGDGSSGNWESTGFAWLGNTQATEYTITVASAEAGVKGSVTIQSIAPPHYPCSPALPNATMEIMPGVGWANAVPDADATIDLEIQGYPLRFEGAGYHDKNWGVTPFLNAVGSWYWGHGRLGPYSIVWYDGLARNGSEYTSSYVAMDGRIISAQCSGIQVRPTGFNSTYPPTTGTGSPQGFQIDLEIGGELGHVTVEVVSTLVTVDSVPYTRWLGTVSGVIAGRNWTGAASYEMFNLEGL